MRALVKGTARAAGQTVFEAIGMENPTDTAVAVFEGLPQLVSSMPKMFIPTGTIIEGDLSEDQMFFEIAAIDGIPVKVAKLLYVEVENLEILADAA